MRALKIGSDIPPQEYDTPRYKLLEFLDFRLAINVVRTVAS